MRPPSPTVPSTLVEQMIHAHQREGEPQPPSFWSKLAGLFK